MKKKVDYRAEFLGRKVNAVTGFSLNESQQEGDTSISNNQPMALQGYLISYNEEEYYLGDEDGEVKQIIRRSNVIALQIDPDEVESEEIPMREDLN